MLMDKQSLYLDDVAVQASNLVGDVIDHWGGRATDGSTTIPHGTMGMLFAHLLGTVNVVYSGGTSLQLTLREADNAALTTNATDLVVGPVVVLASGLDTVGTILIEAFGIRVHRRYTGIWATEAGVLAGGGVTCGWIDTPQANTPAI